MRVCLVSRELAPFYGGGIGTYISMMAKAFVEAGHEVHVLTDTHQGLIQRAPALRPGVHFHQVQMTEGLVAKDGWPCWPMRYAMAVYLKLLELHETHNFEYIEFPDWLGEGYFACRAKRTLGQFKDAVLSVKLHTPFHEARWCNHDSWYDMERAYCDEMETSSMRQCDALLSPTHSLLKLVVDRLGPTTGRLDRTIRSPFDQSCIQELLEGAHVDPAPDEQMTVLYYGRMEYRKGVSLLIQAGQRLLERGLNVNFELIGSDTQSGPFSSSMLEHLQKEIQSPWQNRFVFHRNRPRNQLGQAIKAATICCFPSIWENYPYVCLESMMMGACVVGSDAGGMGEIIIDGTSGLLFEATSVDSLEATLFKALSDPELRAKCAEGAPKRVEQLCNPDRVVKDTLQAVEDARLQLRPVKISHVNAEPQTDPTVSIIIPFYNLGAFLPDTLKSVRGQTWTDYEVIIIDDGSDDPASCELMECIQAHDSDIRVVRQPNAGLGAARNRGLAEARGRYYLPLDADDLIDPTYLAKTVAVMQADEDLAYVTSLVRYFKDEPQDATGAWAPLGLIRHILPVANCGGVPACLFNLEKVQAVGGYDTVRSGYEDWDLYCKLAQQCQSATVIPEFLFYYRVREDSMLRVDCLPRHNTLRSYLASRHPELSTDVSKTSQLFIAECKQAQDQMSWHQSQLDQQHNKHETRRDQLQRQVNELEQQLAAGSRANGQHDARSYANQLIEENLRYRIADRINNALKRMGLHKSAKALTRRTIDPQQADRHQD